MEYEHLLVEKEGNIATITLNQPEKLNAISRAMGDNLLLARDELVRDDEVRVVIVTGAGRGFCAGIDLTRARAEPTRFERYDLSGSHLGGEAFCKLGKPVIAAINGPCVGAGFALALSCDIRIASEAARFGSVFVLRGIIPDTGASYHLPRVVGTSKALELMFTGDIIDAAEAERLGIVSRVAPPDELMKVTRELAGRIAQQPPLAIELTKKIVWRRMLDELAHQLDLETWANQICTRSEDAVEAARSFLEKRPPAPYKGR